MHNTLDYFQLIDEARRLDLSACTRTIRLAVLADFATQQLIPLLKVFACRNGFRLEVYEAGYDSIDVEILDSQSGLYAFDPHFIAILVATEKLKARFYGATEANDKASFATNNVDRFVTLWDVVRKNSNATIIQGNYVLPTERAFGSYEMKVELSPGSVIGEINFRLAQEARSANNVLLCDTDYLAASVGRYTWTDERLWHLAKAPCSLKQLPLLAKSVTDIALAASGRIVKCVVLDLDNTLWGGVIGDDGLAGLVLGGYDEGEAFVAFQLFLRELKHRGIILAVVSKNDHANAILPFREHPHMVLAEDDISVFIANWENKPDNIRTIQKILNIGFESIVFLDDNPFERNAVREFLPSVVVPELPEDPAHYVRVLAELNLFETASFSEADKQRPGQYREESRRELSRVQHTNITDYLKSLDMTIALERFNEFNLPRIAQLIQRSNQFNLATNRYSEAACEAFMNDPRYYAPFTLTLSDKFGDYGLICVVILRFSREEIEIDEWLMSCRVLQRGVESFAMNKIFELAAEQGARQVRGRYIRSAKNSMVADFYARFGFERIGESDDGSTEWTLSVASYKPGQTHIRPNRIDAPFPASDMDIPIAAIAMAL
jgi:FkbH-like protein